MKKNCSDLFNLPLPALWTVVLGEHDRTQETGHEQRIPVEKIVMHEKYHHFKHDIVLMKLSRPAKISISSQVAKICLPFADLSWSPYSSQLNHLDEDLSTYETMGVQDNGNYLRSYRRGRKKSQRVPAVSGTARQHVAKVVNDTLLAVRFARKIDRRRNDKFANSMFSSKRLSPWNRDIQMEVSLLPQR